MEDREYLENLRIEREQLEERLQKVDEYFCCDDCDGDEYRSLEELIDHVSYQIDRLETILGESKNG